MPFFDEDEYGTASIPAPEEQSAQDRAVEAAANDLAGEESIDDRFLEADKRLRKASYYREIARNGVVENEAEEAQEINAEVRAWAYEQMNCLLGMEEKSEPKKAAPFPFSDNEISVLKKIAEKLIAGPSGKSVEPVVTKIQVQPTRTALLKKQPEIKPAPTKAAPKSPVKTGAKTAQDPKAPEGLLTFNDPDSFDYDTVPFDTPFKDPFNGKIYKFVESPKDGSRMRVSIGRKQTKNPTALPMPSTQMMQQINQTQAMNSLGAATGGGDAASGVLNIATQLALKG